MKHLRLLIAALLIFGFAPASFAHMHAENGGVIILHADFHFFCSVGSRVIIVIVVEDEEYSELQSKLHGSTSSKRRIVVDEDNQGSGMGDFEVALRPVRDDGMAGFLVDSAQPVLVIPQSEVEDYQ